MMQAQATVNRSASDTLLVGGRLRLCRAAGPQRVVCFEPAGQAGLLSVTPFGEDTMRRLRRRRLPYPSDPSLRDGGAGEATQFAVDVGTVAWVASLRSQ